MAISIQKANFWKRFSAWMLDSMMVVLLCTTFFFPFSSLFGYDTTRDKMQVIVNANKPSIEQEYGINLDEDYDELSDDQKALFDKASEALNELLLSNEEFVALYAQSTSRLLCSIALALFVSVMIAHFAIPLFIKNGQSLGKKVFGLAVIRTNCVKASPIALFIRAAVGMFAIETVAFAFLAAVVPVGTIAAVGMLILQAYVMIKTYTNSVIHDLISDTAVVDYASQQIFESEEELTEFLQRTAAEATAKNA